MNAKRKCHRRLVKEALVTDIFKLMLKELGLTIKPKEPKPPRTGLYTKRDADQTQTRRPQTSPGGSKKSSSEGKASSSGSYKKLRQTIADNHARQAAASLGGSKKSSSEGKASSSGSYKKLRQTIADNHARQAAARGQNVATDPFVGSPDVVGLQEDNFNDFLREKDAAMVMFYVTSVPACGLVKAEVQEAAKITERPNHAFAAVDCMAEVGLCTDEKVRTVPSYKLYSLGRPLADFDNTMVASELKKVVETAPLAQSPKP